MLAADPWFSFCRPSRVYGLDVSRSEQEQLREYYELYAHRVFERCRYLLRSHEEAEDAMHEVFIKAQKNLASFRGDASPLTWLTRIATNHCFNVIRAKKAAWHDRFKQEVLHAPRGDDAGARHTEANQLLRMCMSCVDAEIAEVATYYFVDEMTQKEITELVGVSAPTLRKRLRMFVEQSREEIKRLMPDVEFKAPPI